MTFEDFHKALTADERWVETMQMLHRGKDVQKAITESYGHLIADEDRLKNSTLSDFKRLVNSWLSNRKPEVKKGKRDISKL
jgi:hypothetical protein